jgi:hypothetical protein
MRASADEELRGLLDSEERLIWSGQPHQGVDFDFGLLLITLFSVAWIGGIGIAVFKGFSEEHWSSRGLVGILFLIAGTLPLAIALVIAPAVRRKTSYALTNDRVLIVTGLITRRVESLELRMMLARNVRIVDGHDNPGWIKFDDFAQRCGYDRNDLCMPEFSNVADANRVGTLIRTAVAAAAKRAAKDDW